LRVVIVSAFRDRPAPPPLRAVIELSGEDYSLFRNLIATNTTVPKCVANAFGSSKEEDVRKLMDRIREGLNDAEAWAR
jgi:hypothetical protein